MLVISLSENSDRTACEFIVTEQKILMHQYDEETRYFLHMTNTVPAVAGKSPKLTLAWMAARSRSMVLRRRCKVMTPARSLPSSSVDSISLAFSWIQPCEQQTNTITGRSNKTNKRQNKQTELFLLRCSCLINSSLLLLWETSLLFRPLFPNTSFDNSM